MLGPVGKNSDPDDCIPLSLWVVGVIVVHELFTREIFANSALVDALLVHTCVDWTNSISPERFPV